jgi:hypothetical protein
MSSTNVVRMPNSQNLKPALNLPEPRVWSPQDLANFLGISKHWIYKRTQEDAEDPIPRIAGVGRLRFDTASPQFQDWMRRQLGYIDSEVSK